MTNSNYDFIKLRLIFFVPNINLKIDFIYKMDCESDTELMEIDYYNIPFTRTKTKQGRDAIIIGKNTYVFKRKNKDETKYWLCQNRKCSASVSTLNENACLINEVHNGHDDISDIEFACKKAEDKVVEREERAWSWKRKMSSYTSFNNI